MRFRGAPVSKLLQEDVAQMIRDREKHYTPAEDMELARDIIVVVRERILREISSLVRENLR